MSIIAKKPDNDKNFEIIPEGTHQAVCYGVWDIGYHTNSFGTKQHKIVVSWEINETIKNEGEYKGKRFVISNRYTLSLSEKANLRKHLESWRGKSFTPDELIGFDVEKLIGANCLLNIAHNEKDGKTYSNILSIMQVPKGTQPMIPENDRTPPEWVKKVAEKSETDVQQSDPMTDFDAGAFTNEEVAF